MRHVGTLFLTVLFLGCGSPPPPPQTSAANVATGPVTVTIELADIGTREVVVPEVADGATLESVMATLEDLEIDSEAEEEVLWED